MLVCWSVIPAIASDTGCNIFFLFLIALVDQNLSGNSSEQARNQDLSKGFDMVCVYGSGGLGAQPPATDSTLIFDFS